MAGMTGYRKVNFWVQAVAVSTGTIAGVAINDAMGASWSMWHRIVVRITCLLVTLGIASVMERRIDRENSN